MRSMWAVGLEAGPMRCLEFGKEGRSGVVCGGVDAVRVVLLAEERGGGGRSGYKRSLGPQCFIVGSADHLSILARDYAQYHSIPAKLIFL